jgi:hypothetical protein
LGDHPGDIMTTTDDTAALNRYLVSYGFDEHRWDGHHDAIESVLRAVAGLQRKGVEIRFLGATQQLNATGRVVDITARYAAPNKGTVGRLNFRARLPANGAPQRIRRGEPEQGDGRQQPAVTTL